MPLNWMVKTEKGPISSFIIERLSEIHTIHQYIPGKLNSIPDSCSRFPMLGPKLMETRGYANSVEEVLKRLPASLKAAATVHFHGGKQSTELRAALKLWFDNVSALTPLNPPRDGKPPPADVAILTPRCEIAPVVLAVYLLSDVPFALLLPVDLLDVVRRPNIFPDSPQEDLARALERSGKLLILQSQMTWVLGNLPGCNPTEIFAARLRTRAPAVGSILPEPVVVADQSKDPEGGLAAGQLPRTLEEWATAQQDDGAFAEMLDAVEERALKHDLWIRAPASSNPIIIVPPSCQELLVRDTHHKMFHLSSPKIFALLRRSYFWGTMKRDVRQWLEDCPQCELNKARQNTAHGLFSALPIYAPRARWCMDFQGQGTALTGETEALALIDPTSRYVVVIPLLNREASTWLQPFLDRIVFTFGTPDVLHSDAAPEFLSEALALLATAADITTTTTLAHNARGNGTIEVFWRFWNRCLRLLPDDHYARWPAFAQRIAFAYNTASHESIAHVSPFQVQHGAPARNPLATRLLTTTQVD
jgi:transposase InsO family protein